MIKIEIREDILIKERVEIWTGITIFKNEKELRDCLLNYDLRSGYIIDEYDIECLLENDFFEDGYYGVGIRILDRE